MVRAIDVPAGGGELAFNVSYDTEAGFDHLIVEVEAADGTRTTLPTTAASTVSTSTASSAACDDGQYTDLHPSLLVYDGIGTCQAPDAAGSWNSFNGSSGGWQDVAFDLSAYAGQTVTVSLSYVTDAGTGGVGVFIDNVRAPGEEPQSFETDLGAWTVPGAPEGSPANASDFVRSEALLELAAGVTTEDSVLLGFGLEHVADPAVRTETMRRALGYLDAP
ncbi:hypothetical protein BH23ACT10_BH23ACT10_03460 [soil metagenome]